MFDVQSQMIVDIPEHCLQLAFTSDNECHAFYDWIMNDGFIHWIEWWKERKQDYD